MKYNYYEFRKNFLPKNIFSDVKKNLSIINNKEQLNIFLNETWNMCLEQKVEGFNFIHAIRKKKNPDNTANVNILINLPYLDDGTVNHEISMIVINTNIVDDIRYFYLEAVDEDILPSSYACSNKKYVIKEINADNESINWGTLVNPRNLVELSDSINIIKG